MKTAISWVVQSVVLLLVFLAGSFLPVFHVLPRWQTALGGGRFFVWDGVVLAVGVYALILMAAFLFGRHKHRGVVSTVALVVALVVGLWMKFPFVGP